MTSSAEAPLAWSRIAELARVDPMVYAAIMDSKFQQGRHHRLVLAPLMRRLCTESNLRIIVNMPPRHSKSYSISQVLPAWYLGNHSDRQIIASSYSSGLATKFGRLVRKQMSSPEFRSIFGEQAMVGGRGTSGSEFLTNSEGSYKAVGVGGSVTGFGAHLLICDDLIKSAATADSATYREALEMYFTETLYTRLMPDANIVLMATRWREDDIIGYVQKEFGEWEVYNIPALCDDPETDLLHRELGEPIWKEYFSTERLLEIQSNLRGSFLALYQGKPVSKAGGILRYSDIRLLEFFEPSCYATTLWSWDLGVTEGGNFTVGTKWAILYEQMVQIDYVRVSVDFADLETLILDKSLETHHTLVEHCHSGLNLKSKIAEVELFQPRKYGSKYDRLQLTISAWRQNLVAILRQEREDFDDCIDEIAKFGKTKTDDYCDSTTQAILWAREKGLLIDLAKESNAEQTDEAPAAPFESAPRQISTSYC